jgi:hypothetical protein
MRLTDQLLERSRTHTLGERLTYLTAFGTLRE